jgi:quercetin dioxygenase-like cupin family protein
MSVPAISSMTALTPAQIAELPWSPCKGWHGVEQKVLSQAPAMEIGLLRLAPGACEAPHRHSSGEHHVWVLMGEVRTPDGTLPAGSYLHVRSGTFHQLSDAGGGSVLLFVFSGAHAAP